MSNMSILEEQIDARHRLQRKLDRLILAAKPILHQYRLAASGTVTTMTGEEIDELRHAIEGAEKS